jgi:hypothetical protein
VLTSRSGRDDEVVERAAWNGLEQRKRGGAVHGFHSDISLVQQPHPWRSSEAANSSVKRKQAVRLGEGVVKKM